jgi:peroxidase
VQTFADINPDPVVQQQLKSLYGNVNNIDLWVGGLAEKHIPGDSLGPTFTNIIANQFSRLRDGDRFWYQND